MLMYNNYYFKPSKYCLIYFIVNTLVYFLNCNRKKTEHN